MTVQFFHGTSTRLLDRARTAGGLTRPHLTDSVERARYYAEEAAEEDGTSPVVVEVRDVDLTRLRHDSAAMEEPVLADEETRDRIWDLAALLHPEWRRGDFVVVPATAWPVSWAAVGSVRYDTTAATFDIVATGD